MFSSEDTSQDNHYEKRVSLTLRLTLSIILIVTIITILTSLAVYNFFFAQSEKHFQQKSTDYLNYLKNNLEIPLWNMDEDSINKICRSFAENEEISTLIVTDYKGLVIFSKKGNDSKKNMMIISDIKFKDKFVGHITFGLTNRHYDEKNRQLLFTTVLIMISVILGLSVGTRLILYRLLQKPIDSLLKRIQEIKKGTYNKGVFKTIYPEIETILDSFNQMAGEVEIREKTLKLTNQKLANEIKESKASKEENKKLEQQIWAAQKMEALGTLAGGIAHDFNNILSAIIGYSELLKDDFKGNEKSEMFIEQVLHGGYRAKELVSQILLFSRQNEIKMIKVKITPLVKEVAKMLKATMPSTIKTKLKILTPHDYVLADPTQIHQIIMNLCTNSAHAMEENGGTLSIEIDQINIDQNSLKHFSDLNTGSYLKIQISDTGHGIPSDLIDKIFDPFYTTKPRGEGTGLGLSVVHGIVKKCSGDIKVYSELNKGTNILVILPLIDTDTQTKNLEENSIPTGNESILFVDDEQPIVDLEKSMLDRLGYKVTGISDSQKAWQLFKNDPDTFDMIITDKTMPGLTGLDLSIKILRLRPEKPIILCTGFNDEESIKKANQIGIKGYIHKPILKTKLAETIRKILDQPDVSHPTS